jgi:hypothetical protein
MSEALSLREAVKPDTRGNLAKFARAVDVSWTTAWRWTLPADDPSRCVPLEKYWDRIEKATDERWKAPRLSFEGSGKRRRRSPAVNAAAARKGWQSRRRREATQ